MRTVVTLLMVALVAAILNSMTVLPSIARMIAVGKELNKLVTGT